MKLYKLYKDSCGPCHTLSAYLKTITLPEDIELVNIDVTDVDNFDMLLLFGVTAVPALVFEDGRKLTGFRSGAEVHNFIFGD